MVFQQTCASCHAQDGKGTAAMVAFSPKVDLTQSPLIRAGNQQAIARSIAQGGGQMPAFAPRMSADQIAALASWCLRFAENS